MGGKEIVERIDLILEKQDKKRNFLYEKLGVNDNTFSLWKKRDTIPNAEMAIKIAELLGVSVEFLITGRERDIPKDVLDMAHEICALPEQFRRFIKMDIEKYKSACISGQEADAASDAV